VNNILFVEDNRLVAKVYCEALEKCGLRVQLAGDGVAALSAMNKAVPDLVVLDLHMPRLGGQEVLRFMRGRPETRYTPVIVFSNVYLAELSESILSLGLDRVVLKESCSPMTLANMVFDVLDEQKRIAQSRKLAAAGHPGMEGDLDGDLSSAGRERFIATAESRLPGIWAAHEQLAKVADSAKQVEALKALHGHIENLAAASGLANNLPLVQLLVVLETLLRQLVETPANITSSALWTVSLAVGHFNSMVGRAAPPGRLLNSPARALVIHVDGASIEAIARALKDVRMGMSSASNATEGLRMAVAEPFDLVLLGVDDPGISGSEFCWRLRKVTGYEKTAVIYVTDNTDFETRARTILSGGADLIARPIFPAELATKAVLHVFAA